MDNFNCFKLRQLSSTRVHLFRTHVIWMFYCRQRTEPLASIFLIETSRRSADLHSSRRFLISRRPLYTRPLMNSVILSAGRFAHRRRGHDIGVSTLEIVVGHFSKDQPIIHVLTIVSVRSSVPCITEAAGHPLVLSVSQTRKNKLYEKNGMSFGRSRNGSFRDLY